MNEVPAVRGGVAEVGDVRLAYEDLGNPDDPAIVLIMGFACQLTAWPDEFCALLANAGYRVVRFDNRDIGLSTKIKARVGGALAPRMLRYWAGRPSSVPYTLPDMAADTVGLLDCLGIESAHVVGASMGGMIAQILAAEHPRRVRSLGILFSSTNQPFLPPPDPRALAALIAKPRGPGREQVVDMLVKSYQAISSPKYPEPEAVVRAQIAAGYDRSYHPAGVIRQLAAAMGTGSLLPYTRRITAPTVVLHGKSDPLIRPACGRAVARAIPNAEIHLISGWAHDLPPQLHATLTAFLLANMS
ncbi:MAG: alpha/beta hydrolase [Mycobacteriaceae bacterium]|nr:alpha/beta hydrolase [Mycobacteriaceae bacterium]